MLVMYVREAEDAGGSAELPCYDVRVLSVRCLRALAQCVAESPADADAASVAGDVLEVIEGVCRLEGAAYACYQCDAERLLLAALAFWRRHGLAFGGGLAELVTSAVEAALALPHMMLHLQRPAEQVAQLEELACAAAGFIADLGRAEGADAALVARLVGALGGIARARASAGGGEGAPGPAATGDALVRVCLENLTALCAERRLTGVALPVLLQRGKEILVGGDSTRPALLSLLSLLEGLTLEVAVVERWLDALPPSATDGAPSRALARSPRAHLLILYSPLVDLAGGGADAEVRAHATRLLKLVGAEIGVGELWLFA